MGWIIIGGAVGFALGAGMATPAGAFVGALVGMHLGAIAAAMSWLRDNIGQQPTVEMHRVACIPRGTPADVELVGDLGTRRWTDVRQCSLEDPDHVDCDKTCRVMMNDARIRPGAQQQA